ADGWSSGIAAGVGDEECAAADAGGLVGASRICGEVQLAHLSVCRGSVDCDGVCLWTRTGVAGDARAGWLKFERQRTHADPEEAWTGWEGSCDIPGGSVDGAGDWSGTVCAHSDAAGGLGDGNSVAQSAAVQRGVAGDAIPKDDEHANTG